MAADATSRASPGIADAPSVETSVEPPRAPVAPPEETARQLRLLPLSLLALVVGIVTGIGAVVFRDLIGLIHNVLFLGDFSVAYNCSLFTPSTLGGRW